ncbi:asparagine-rich protein precursor [Bombyx mori]|uniref:Vitelline membrane protein P90 n=1 Tax=Bombyx mori TaxID=7091 RepID=R4I4E8_BOMMO|nr:asparagine-rich protein precursor [Bombyx mori]AFJ04511.1 vitelline membrane protein P90 precursor [Bombyx mori]
METLVVLFAVIYTIIAAPAQLGEHLDTFKTLNGDFSDTTVRERKSTAQAELDHHLNQNVDDGISNGRSLHAKKPIIVKKKIGYHLYRDSDEEKRLTSSRENCNEKVKVKLCDEEAALTSTGMGRSTTTEDIDDHLMSEEDMKQSLKMAKEAIANLERDLQKMDTKSSPKSAQMDEIHLEAGAEVRKDIDVAKEALEQIHQNFGNLESMSLHASTSDDPGSIHNVHLTVAKTEEERIAQWKEAMENIQKNIEIARNIEDSFKFDDNEKLVDENSFLEASSSEVLNANTQLTEKSSANKDDMNTAASNVHESDAKNEAKFENNNLGNDHKTTLRSSLESELSDNTLKKQPGSMATNEHFHTNNEIGATKVSKNSDLEINTERISFDLKPENNDEKPTIQSKSNEYLKSESEKDNKNTYKKEEIIEKLNDTTHTINNSNSHGTDQKAESATENRKTQERQPTENDNVTKVSVQMNNDKNEGLMKSADIEHMPKINEPAQHLSGTNDNIKKAAMPNSKNNEMSTAQSKFEESNNFRIANHNSQSVGHHHTSTMKDVNHLDTMRTHMRMDPVHKNLNDHLIHGQVYHDDHIDTAFHSNMRDSLNGFRPDNTMFQWKPSQERTVYGPAMSSHTGSSAVGVFPNANIGSCGIPLLLSCSPSVTSGSLAKALPSGYSAPAYRMEEDFAVFPNKREIKKGNEIPSVNFKTMTTNTKMKMSKTNFDKKL